MLRNKISDRRISELTLLVIEVEDVILPTTRSILNEDT